MIHAFSNARFDEKIGVIVLTGEDYVKMIKKMKNR